MTDKRSTRNKNHMHSTSVPLHALWINLAHSTRSPQDSLEVCIPTSKRKLNRTGKESIHLIQDISESRSQSRRFLAHIVAIKLLLNNAYRDRVATVRELYYQDVSSFRKEIRVCYEAINNVIGNGGTISEKDYGIIPSAKGLIYGGPNFEIRLQRGHKICLKYLDEPTLAPHDCEGLTMQSHPSAIVIFEKDSVFKSYCHHFSGSELSLKGSFLFLTAKGYPDRLTLRFLHTVTSQCPDSKIFAFVDSDVYGINIYNSYRQGLGCVGNTLKYQGVFLLDYASGWLTVSRRDVLCTIAMIRRNSTCFQKDFLKPNIQENIITRELTRGLLLFKKAEMNMVDSSGGSERNLFSYIDRKLNILFAPLE